MTEKMIVLNEEEMKVFREFEKDNAKFKEGKSIGFFRGVWLGMALGFILFILAKGRF